MAAQVRVTPQAKAIHDSAIVIDTHADTTQYFLDPAFDLAKPPIDIHLDLDKAKRGNLAHETRGPCVVRGQFLK